MSYSEFARDVLCLWQGQCDLMRSNRIARPRGGARRPGQGQARPPGLPSPGVQQPMPPIAPSSTNNAEASQQHSGNFAFGHSTQQQGGTFTFGMPATNTNTGASTFEQPANNTQTQTGSLIFGQPTTNTQKQGNIFSFGSSAKENQQANASKVNQASASFPTAGASSSTGFTASSFAPANASFDFTPAQPQLEIPKNTLQKGTSLDGDIRREGFSGQIFKLKPDARWNLEGRATPQWAPMHEGSLIPIDPRLLADQRPPGTPANPIVSPDLSNQNHAPSTSASGIQLNASSQPEAGEARKTA